MRQRCSALLLLVLATACGSNAATSPSEAGLPSRDGGVGGTFPDGGSSSPGPTLPPLPPEVVALCAQKTAPTTVPGTSRCLGDLAKATFLFAECACENVIIGGSAYAIDGINSAQGGAAAVAAVGANGRFSAAGIDGNALSGGTIKGSLWAGGIGAGGNAIDLGATTVDGDAHCGGNLTGVGSVKGDAYITGALTGGARVDGSLHQPSSSPAPAPGMVGGSVIVEPVSVPPPCNCQNPLPIASIVAQVENDNDNAALGLTRTSLNAAAGPTSLTLGCGKFYFDEITASQVSIRVGGPTAIFVAGKIDSMLSINVDPGAQVDLFVAGDAAFRGAWSLGLSAAPANTRIYLAGANVVFEGAGSVNGNLYAPNASFAATAAAFNVRGSLYARNITVTESSHQITYDQAVQELVGCQPQGGGCTSCRDCAGATPSCKSGTCAKCTTNADCCAPLACQADGTCRSPVN